jgi:hypothetical protein
MTHHHIKNTVPPLTFGRGIHFCIGAPLARAQMAEALPILARRLGRFEIDGVFTWRPRGGIEGPISLPIRFDSSSHGGASQAHRAAGCSRGARPITRGDPRDGCMLTEWPDAVC